MTLGCEIEGPPPPWNFFGSFPMVKNVPQGRPGNFSRYLVHCHSVGGGQGYSGLACGLISLQANFLILGYKFWSG